MDQARLVFEGRRIRVETLRIRDRDGRERDYERVVHPGAAVVLPLLDDGRVVLIRQWRYAIDQELLELPAGTVDPPEPPMNCALRELAEETGYRAGRLRPLVSFYSTPGFCTERLHAFVAEELEAGETAPDPGEDIRCVPMEYADALAAIADGRITDGKTIVTLLYYDRFGRGGV